MPRLFALDRNFPQPIVSVLSDFQADATLVPLDAIDPRLSTLDDWELLLALHHHADPWDGLITTDSSMLTQGPELAALIQTKLTLVIAMESGHNPVKASGLLFAYLAGISQRTTPERPQVWRLNAANRAHDEPMGLPGALRAAQRAGDQRGVGGVQTLGSGAGPRSIALTPAPLVLQLVPQSALVLHLRILSGALRAVRCATQALRYGPSRRSSMNPSFVIRGRRR
jgi:hypothetical protein